VIPGLEPVPFVDRERVSAAGFDLRVIGFPHGAFTSYGFRCGDLSLIVDVEAPEYGEVRAFMGVHDALDVAIEAEVKAYEFYDGALGSVEDEDVRSLFEFLREQEVRHQEMIREFKSRVPEDSGADPDDYVDEPRAQ
jgi:hypothetical protein